MGDAADAESGRGVPLTGVDDSGAGADEDSGVEDEPQQRGLMIPASMGLRCQIPETWSRSRVTRRGACTSRSPRRIAEKARIVRRYKRTPVEIPKRITVADLRDSGTTEIPLQDKVVLRVDRHDDPERGCRLIEIALCNDRETPRKIPVDAWLYQTKLTVAADGAEVFLPVSDPLLDTRYEPDDELRRLNLQYRDRLEFAVGRTCSVDWAVADRRAAGQQGVDDVAADMRDAAGRRGRDRRHARHAGAGDGEPASRCGLGYRRSSSSTGVAGRRGGAGPGTAGAPA